jgi:hypothetical protein
LAVVLAIRGKMEEAESLYWQAVAWREHLLGPTHTDTLITMRNLTFCLDMQGRYEEEEALQRYIHISQVAENSSEITLASFG